MRFLLVLAIAVTFAPKAQALFLQHCFNHGQGVSHSFQSCVNRNFREIDRELNTFSGYCTNFSRTEVDYSFTSCIDRNFRTADREIDTFLQFCSNFRRDELSFSYISCVNRNFSTIEREIRNRD
jgi:uncharacterized protein YecT (DUF1311 family)